MRLRALVGAAGHPARITSAPFDVLENGVVGARWVVADRSLDEPLNDARANLLRTLQARTGKPARPLRQVLVRLPRRLSGPRLHGGPLSTPVWEQEEGQLAVERGNLDGWAEAVRWLRGLPPTSEPVQSILGLPWLWEHAYRRAGLGSPTPQRDPRRRRSRRGRSRRQHDLEREFGLRPSFAEQNRAALAAVTGIPRRLLFGDEPSGFTGGETLQILVDHETPPLVSRPAEENPELPVRLDPPAPPEPLPPALTLRDLRQARANLYAELAQTNEDGTYNAFLGPDAFYELRCDPEFQRLAAGLLNEDDRGSFLTLEGLRLHQRRKPGWSVEPVRTPRSNHAVLDFRVGTFIFAGGEHEVRGQIRSNNQIDQIDQDTYLGSTMYSTPRTWEVDLEGEADLGLAIAASRDRRLSLDVILPGHNGFVRCNAFVRESSVDWHSTHRGRSSVSLTLLDPVR